MGGELCWEQLVPCLGARVPMRCSICMASHSVEKWALPGGSYLCEVKRLLHAG